MKENKQGDIIMDKGEGELPDDTSKETLLPTTRSFLSLLKVKNLIKAVRAPSLFLKTAWNFFERFFTSILFICSFIIIFPPAYSYFFQICRGR